MLAYEPASRLLPNDPIPLLAPLTALLVAQLTIVQTVKSSLERVGSVVAGVVVALLLSKVGGRSAWSLAIVIFASLVVGQLLHLGEQQLEVPISAMVVLAVVGQARAADTAAGLRDLETLIGAVIGVAVSAMLGPPVYVQPAGDAIGALADDLAGLLAVMGEELTEGGRASRPTPGRAAPARWTPRCGWPRPRWPGVRTACG